MRCRYDYSKLKGRIKETNVTQEELAKTIGIGRVSLNQKLNNKQEFSQIEISKICDILEINELDIGEYFFKNVQQTEHTMKNN